jgi:hypothetical protein
VYNNIIRFKLGVKLTDRFNSENAIGERCFREEGHG